MRLAARLFVVLFLAAPLATARAQDGQSATPQGAARDPKGKKILGLADVARWRRINGAAISADGAWVTYAYAPNDGDPTLYVKAVDKDKTYDIPGGSGAVFSVFSICGLRIISQRPSQQLSSLSPGCNCCLKMSICVLGLSPRLR